MTGTALTIEATDPIEVSADGRRMVQEERRRDEVGGDLLAPASDTLLTLAERYGVNSAPVAAYVGGLLRR